MGSCPDTGRIPYTSLNTRMHTRMHNNNYCIIYSGIHEIFYWRNSDFVDWLAENVSISGMLYIVEFRWGVIICHNCHCHGL